MEAGKHIELCLGQEPGEFRLNLDGIAITVHLNNLKPGAPAGLAAAYPTSVPAAPVPAVAAEPCGPDADTEKISAELEHYRQVSREIYEGLGRLAKDINLSIQDLSPAEILQTAIGSPGEHLDQARTQVTDVLEMTEQATLNIMNLVEQIREDCRTVQTKLMTLTEESSAEDPDPAPAADTPADHGLWDQVLSQAEEMDYLLHPAQSREAPAGPGIPLFSLADILQILLEFCTNEKVKQHLKAVQAKQDAIFRTAEAEQALSLLATGGPQEDGFHQLPVEPLLNILRDHCNADRVKDLLVKMASSAQKLFPVPALPLEAQEMEESFGEELPEPPGNPEVAACWEKLQQNLKTLSEHRQANIPGNAGSGSPLGGTAEVKEILETVDRITDSLSRIIEALSFQDLSGQRLLKILKIIRQLQVQVLTLLVAAGQRLLVNLDDQPLPPQESDLARNELDRLLHNVATPTDEDFTAPPDDQPLDQSAVNDLLTGMGF
jgi:chemotaxis regulatin CheY-phosphate phosphatase CheZ